MSIVRNTSCSDFSKLDFFSMSPIRPSVSTYGGNFRPFRPRTYYDSPLPASRCCHCLLPWRAHHVILVSNRVVLGNFYLGNFLDWKIRKVLVTHLQRARDLVNCSSSILDLSTIYPQPMQSTTYNPQLTIVLLRSA